MKTSVKLNNGTVLEVGKTYEFDKFERGDYFTMVFIGKDKMAYQYNSDEIEHFISIDKRLLIIPYTAPQEEINWKTFLIEIDWNGYTSREIVQFESMEIAERHYNSAISIAEVKLNIEPVNS